MVAKALKEIIKRAETWPESDQVELAEIARTIETRHLDVYILTDEERTAIAKAKKSKLVPDKKMKAFWKKYGIA